MTNEMEILCQCVMTSIQVFFGFHFFVRFLQKKIKLCFSLLFGGVVVGVIYFAPGGTIVELGIFALSLAAAGIFVFHTDWKTAVLYAVLTVEIMQLSYGIVNSLSSILYPYLFVFEQNTVGLVFMLAGEAASLLLTGLCYRMARRYFSDEMYSFRCGTMGKQYLLLAFIPILMIFIMDEYINSFVYGMAVANVDGAETELYTNHYQMLAIQLLGMSSLFCILFAYKKLLQGFCLSTELSLLEQKERSLNRYVEEAKARYDETKSFRHDIRNHIAVVKRLLRDGKLEQAISYIEDLDETAEKMSFPCRSNNPVVDILVGNKLGIAKGMGIRADCTLLLPYPCGLRDMDICIILSNALDNAICACKNLGSGKEKYIHISGCMQGDFLMMEIENSFCGKGALKKGTGLSNIKTVAEKYGGAMNIETRGNTFILHVLLIIPRRANSLTEEL